jgi:tetratricopeptide (TPR) repeat protein
MLNKLYLHELRTICQALGDFAEARSKPQPDRDLILTVQKINGRETLESVRLSEMSWFSRVIRWFGFGGATLTSVARFLKSHEPYLPSRFADISRRNLLEYSYEDRDVDDVMNLDKPTYKQLKQQKSKGCEIFKECLVHHNKRSRFEVFVLLQEWEKTNLRNRGSLSFYGVADSWPNPMGPLDQNGKRSMLERYHPPILDFSEFAYLDPFFRKTKDSPLPHVLGFCYEYGLGTKEQRDEAYKQYEMATGNQYSACYNMGRMLVEDGRPDEAIDYLTKGEDLLIAKIGEAQQAIDDAKNRRDPSLQEIEDQLNLCIKECKKALKKIYFIFTRAYIDMGDVAKTDEYALKI